MTDAGLHIMVVIEANHATEFNWGRARREAGERDAFISILAVSGRSARWLLPPARADTVPTGINLVCDEDAAASGVGAAVSDKLFEAQALIASIRLTEVRPFVGAVVGSELSRVFNGDASIRVQVAIEQKRPSRGRTASVKNDLLRLIKV